MRWIDLAAHVLVVWACLAFMSGFVAFFYHVASGNPFLELWLRLSGISVIMAIWIVSDID